MEKIKEKLNNEKEILKKLEIKRDALNEKIRLKQTSICKYENMLKQQKFSSANDVFMAKGLTFDEIMEAVKKGDFTNLQEKMEEKSSEPSDAHVSNTKIGVE